MNSALLVPVNTLGISVRDRVISRISFYLLVFAVMWIANRFLPDWNAIEEKKWEERGVVPYYIAVPLSELSIPQSR